ncbi:helix-turn-helix domain-containing protein [Bernardetia sp. Wsw4-3y2]|uniref:helix-turn-helix domain-containing protein n=1 Tax=Bernardetia sp. Wsw4-3y2 TaxID=3127471 RepID=UPI0030D278D1
MAKKRTTKTGLDYSTAEAKARKDYLENKKLTQEDVAQLVGVTRGTINKWAARGDWEKLRKVARRTPRQIERKIQENMNRLLDDELTEEEQTKAIKKADALSKMNAVLKTLSDPERRVLNTIDVCEDFAVWLAHRDLEFSKKVSIYQTEYISELTKTTNGQN